MVASELADRVDAVRQIMKIFQPERICYLVAATVSIGIILYCGVRIIGTQPTAASLTGIFGSSGLISIGMGRLLTMWSQALRLVAGEKLGG